MARSNYDYPMNPVDIISPHSRQAAYYQYRIQYLEKLFVEVANILGLGSESKLLDLCCGSGQLVSGFADYAGEIVGIDGAQGMISVAKPFDNAVYICHDVNSNQLPNALAGKLFNHIVIGRAIAYISDESIRRYLHDHLAENGCVVICGGGLSPSTEWALNLNRLRGSYAKVRGDFIGQEKLAKCDYFFDGRVSIRARAMFDLQFLLRYALSFALSHEAIKADIARFKQRLIQLAQAHLVDGKLHGEIVSWALIYRPARDLQLERQQAADLLKDGIYPL